MLSCLSLAAPLTAQPESSYHAGKYFDHIVVLVMEDQGTSQALADPNIAALVRQSAWFSNYHGLTHPALPNYLALVAGSTLGVKRDRVESPIKARSIVDRLEQKGLSWKAYAGAKRRAPLLNFASVRSNPRRYARIVNAEEFLRDARAARLPAYSFYSPNLFNDGHDTALETESTWLGHFVQAFGRTAAAHQRALLAVVWDEGGGEDARSNRVLAMLFGDVVRPGRYSANLTHYSLLRTIEDNFGLLPLADGDAKATPIPDAVWR